MAVSPEAPQIVRLSNAQAHAEFAPSMGGLLMKWTVDGRDVIHWPRDPDWAPPHHFRGGDPLLFPFIARHYVDGKLGYWKDAAGVVRALPMHGFARDLPFEHAVDADGQGIAMTLRDDAATRRMYPFGFAFTARFRLQGAALESSLETTNTGDAPMPYYPGHHFYLAVPAARRGDCVLHLPDSTVQEALPHGGVTAPRPGPSRCALSDPQLLDRFHVLRQAGPVHLDMPWQGRRVSFDLADTPCPWYAVTTWTESDSADFYCIEPWLGLPDAIHHGQGLRWLQPGQTEVARCRISVEPLAAMGA